MQTAANTSRFLTGCSSSVGLADSEIVVSRGGFLQHIVANHLAQTVHSQELFVKLTNQLIRFAEQFHIMLDLPALEEVSRILMNLPVDAARQIGLYYHALPVNRRGQRDEIEGLLNTVADSAPLTYRARAIQALGALHHYNGQLAEVLRFQLEALRMASDKGARDLQTILISHLEISLVKGETGDHKGALAILENVSPLVHEVAKQRPFYFYVYQNELAIELGEAGRIPEATAASAIALASPYAAAYPNWAETRQELEAKRATATPSVVAINRAPEAEQSAQLEPQRKPESPRRLAFTWPAGDKQPFQTSAIPFPATARSALNTMSILDRVLICAGSRAPPLLF
jgi:hypothetical protein